MKYTKNQIIAAIDALLQKGTKQYYSDFYIGITDDVNRRLFTEHNVDKANAWWIYRDAIDKSTAQAVEEYYLNKGMEGDTGGGTVDSTYVYCHQISGSTKE